VFKKYGIGSLDNYLTQEELSELLESMEAEFPEVVTPVEIGKSAEGREISGYLFSAAPNEKRPSILLNGAHHARELTSISMVVWLMLRFLYSWEQGQTDIYSRLVQNNSVYFIPVVNTDGF
jgi:murein tripeptide amidase MpaA